MNVLNFYSKIFFLTFLLTVLTAMQIHAKLNRPPTPITLKGGQILDIADAKQLWDSGEALFFDTRSPLNYGKSHIKGARSLPYKEESAYSEDFDASLDRLDLSKLPANKQQVVVVYSHGNTGWKSYKAAVQLIRMGYRHVYGLREGYSHWMTKQYPVE